MRGDGEVYLGLAPGTGCTIPGVLLHVTPAQLANLRVRERYYKLVRVPPDALEPPTRNVVVFYPLAWYTTDHGAPSVRYRRLVERVVTLHLAPAA